MFGMIGMEGAYKLLFTSWIVLGKYFRIELGVGDITSATTRNLYLAKYLLPLFQDSDLQVWIEFSCVNGTIKSGSTSTHETSVSANFLGSPCLNNNEHNLPLPVPQILP